MIGFQGRGYNVLAHFTFEYVGSPHRSRSSFVLANAIFLHRNYYVLYQAYVLKWKYVIDRWQACEDIAMSFMVADLCQCAEASLLVKGSLKSTRKEDYYQGLSKRKGHGFQRSFCMTRFVESLGNMPFIYNTKIY